MSRDTGVLAAGYSFQICSSHSITSAPPVLKWLSVRRAAIDA